MTYSGSGVWNGRVHARGLGSGPHSDQHLQLGEQDVQHEQLRGRPRHGKLSTKVARPYVSDDASGSRWSISRLDSPDHWLTASRTPIERQRDFHRRSMHRSGSRPPLQEKPTPTEDPIPLRVWNTPSQSQTLDCQTSGASGWQQAMEFGCVAYQIYNQAWHTSGCGSSDRGAARRSTGLHPIPERQLPAERRP